MTNKFSKYIQEFDQKFCNMSVITRQWYKDTLDVDAFCSTASARDAKWNWSEEYIRARFVYAMIHSWMYQKEYICVEFWFPKWNGAKSLNPDIVVFKNKDWKENWEEAKQSKSFSKIRQNVLVIFETKKNNKSVREAIENQLRSAMELNTSEDRIFWVYFDDEEKILIFKKSWNSEIRRFNDRKSIQQEGMIGWSISDRDSMLDLPSQKDFIENNESISDVAKLKLDFLDPIDETNFTFVGVLNDLKRANDSLRPESPIRELIVEFLTLKVYDEKARTKDGGYLQFYIRPDEKSSDWLASESFRQRFKQLYTDAAREYQNVLASEKRLFLYDSDLRPNKTRDEKFLVKLVESFQQRWILKSRHESFNQIIFNNFWGEKAKEEKWQFFTPIPIVHNMVKMINPIKGEDFCDPCCGICDFPAMGFRHSHRMDQDYPPTAPNYFGFDIEGSNLKLAELNLVLNGDGGAVLKEMNSLSQKLREDGTPIPEWEFTTENYNPKTWKHRLDPTKDIKKYKIIATNPPFWKGRDLKTGAKWKWDLPENTVQMYETFWEKSELDNKWNKKYPNSMDMWVLFLENAYKTLEDGGRMAIVVSNSIASIKEWKNIRRWFIKRMRIVGTFDLPSNTFWETGVATTVIIAYKPKANEQDLLTANYEVFVKEIEHIGYEVKTKQRTVHFDPQFIIDEESFEKTWQLSEDFTQMQAEWKEFLQRQEEELKLAFHISKMD